MPMVLEGVTVMIRSAWERIVLGVATTDTWSPEPEVGVNVGPF